MTSPFDPPPRPPSAAPRPGASNGQWKLAAIAAFLPVLGLIGGGLWADGPPPAADSQPAFPTSAPQFVPAATSPEWRHPAAATSPDDMLQALQAESPSPTTWPDVKRPNTRVVNCTESNCHLRERSFKFVHGPTGVGACDVCHSYSDEKAHKFELKRQKDALCNFCHVGKVAGRFVHKAVADGQCLGCHNPHGGAERTLLRTANMGKLCASCHGEVTKVRKYGHGPVASGNCASCHNAHSSDLPKLLVAEGRTLCLGCHDQMDKQLKQVQFTHKPVGGDCLQCHESHASNYPKQLKQAPADLCLSCHQDTRKLIAAATVRHSPVTDSAACQNCHTPHGSDFAKLMKDSPVKACMTCHAKDIAVDKRVVPGMPAMLDPAMNKHGPIRDGNCGGCHNVHGGTLSWLLTKDYPEAFYQPFSVEKYALCFSCHNKDLVAIDRTLTLTSFRNGDLNLHYLHVHKQTQGRNCRACHETHYSKRPLHIRETTPYGQWDMPIKFTATRTGGACASGCHQVLAYDRVNPVPRPPTAATLPEAASRPAGTQPGAASQPGEGERSPTTQSVTGGEPMTLGPRRKDTP